MGEKRGVKDDTRFLAGAAERMEWPLTKQERLREAGLGEDKELALAVFSARCPADTQ